ncbi:MAG: TolC family protein, partial [Verrucomicrobiota bacterium]|nr:TolC family protein [Verrucomicrobiota bacterium]
MRRWLVVLLIALSCACARAERLTLSEALALAKRQNPDVVVARKQLEAAHGGVIEARAGLSPSVISTGLLRKRAQQEQSRLRDDDYNASVRAVQSIYTAGANKARVAIARLIEEKRALELAAVEQRVAMDLRSAYYELLLNRSQIEVREEAVSAMRDELRAQEERFAAGTVGELNVRRAEVSLGNEQPELY